MFLDASAIVCIVTQQPEAASLAARLNAAVTRLTSALAAYEASQAVARKRDWTTQEAADLVDKFLSGAGVTMVAIGAAEFRAAILAHDRFGRGRHPARLNMCDCFAYACAHTNNVPLLLKGEDFTLTDVGVA